DFFFFQAEDGIRDFHVTGVETCALPISLYSIRWTRSHLSPLRAPSMRRGPSPRFTIVAVKKSRRRPSGAVPIWRSAIGAKARSEIGRASCRERVETCVGARLRRRNMYRP